MPQTPTSDPAFRQRFYKALAAYGVLAVLAAFALKSWVHLRRIELE